MTIGITNAAQDVSTPAPKSRAANCSGTTKAYAYIGKDARKITEESTKRKMFMVLPVFHSPSELVR